MVYVVVAGGQVEPVGKRPRGAGNGRLLHQGLLFTVEKLNKHSNLRKSFFLPAQGVPRRWGGAGGSAWFQEAPVVLEQESTSASLVTTDAVSRPQDFKGESWPRLMVSSLFLALEPSKQTPTT